MVEWLSAAADGAPLVDIGVRPPLEASLVVREGWRALRRCFRQWGIESRHDLSPHLVSLGFRPVSPGQSSPGGSRRRFWNVQSQRR